MEQQLHYFIGGCHNTMLMIGEI